MAFARQHSADARPQGLSRPAYVTLAVPTSKPVNSHTELFAKPRYRGHRHAFVAVG
jgi:hypothetical protein